jgi:glycine oxidase
VGGGVIGLAIAWRLLQRDRRVAVLERAQAGRGATWAAAGMLAPSAEIMFEEPDLFTAGRESVRRWPAFAAELASTSGIDPGYETDGTLLVADDRDAAAALRRLHAFQEEAGAPVELLSAEAALDREPLLSPRIVGAVFSPYDHRVDPRATAEALAAIVEKAGALREGSGVDAIEPGEPATVVFDDGSRLIARVVIVAAGAWSAGLKGFAPAPSVRPVKGQAVALRMTETLRLRHAVRTPRAYLVPRSDGRLVVGATVEDVGFDMRVTAGGIYRVLEGAVRVVPAVEEMELVETWAGPRPASRDQRPLLGQVARGVWFATGHYRHGVLLAPLTADEIALEVDAALDGRRETSTHLAPFRPGRMSDEG